MNSQVKRMAAQRIAKLVAGLLLLIEASGVAQSGGVVQPGPGKGGDAFKMWTLRCTIKGNAPGSPSPEDAGARWRTKGSQKWNDPGEKVLLPPGTYTIEFKGKLEGWIAPADKAITLDRDRSEIGTYRRREPEPPKPEKEEPKPPKETPKPPKDGQKP